MNLLLDTHIALWAVADSPRLSATARSAILNPRATPWVSVASLWEISIKHSLGRGGMPIDATQALNYFERSGYRILAIKPEHVLGVAQLPPHHQDPFDRLILAQAITEPMRLLTADAMLSRYTELAEVL